MSIFHHVDRDGDEIEVLAGTHLEFHSAGKVGAGMTVHVDRQAALRLRNALTDWLGLSDGPVWVTEDRVRALITEALANPRPLHHSPQAGPVEGAPYCEIPGCTKFPTTGRHFEHDPEPRDVGHPEPEELCGRIAPADAHPASRCTFCGFVWQAHRKAELTISCGLCGAEWTDGHGQPGDPCTHIPAWRQLVGCECGHAWRQHDHTGCTRVHPTQLDCRRTPPSAHPVPECTPGSTS